MLYNEGMDDQTEKLNSESVLEQKSTNGGARPGAGRKKGQKNPETIEREAIGKEIKLRIAQQAQRLVDAQLGVALGNSFLFCVSYEGTGKDRKKVVEQVTDIETIRAYLNDELNQQGDEEYYYVTTEKPDSKAIDSLLDRAFGRPIQGLTGNLCVDINNVINEFDDDYNPDELEETAEQGLENEPSVQDKG